MSESVYPRLLLDSSIERAMEQPVVLSEAALLACMFALHRHGIHRVDCSSELAGNGCQPNFCVVRASSKGVIEGENSA